MPDHLGTGIDFQAKETRSDLNGVRAKPMFENISQAVGRVRGNNERTSTPLRRAGGSRRSDCRLADPTFTCV
jgi:hypothetical protein